MSHRLWHKGDYSSINDYLSYINWDFELAYMDVNSAYLRFVTILHSLIDQYIPLSQKSHSSKPQWFKHPPVLKQCRATAWQQYKAIRTQHGRSSLESLFSLQQYLQVNHEHRNVIIVKQCEYKASLVANVKDNPKLFYLYIRNKKVGIPSIGPLRSPEGHVEMDSRRMSEIFASAFSSVYTINVLDRPSAHQVFNEPIPQLDITLRDVSKVISQLESFSSMGPDDVHPFLLK